MEKVIPRTMRKFETYQNQIYKNAVLGKLQQMTKGRLELDIGYDRENFIFGLGKRVKAEIQVKHPNFFPALLKHGEIGFGDSYASKEWDSPDIVSAIKWFILNAVEQREDSSPIYSLYRLFDGIDRIKHNLNQSAYNEYGKKHIYSYDLGEGFFEKFLDKDLNRSSGLFPSSDTSLEDAQLYKYEAIGRRLNIVPEDRVIELGCGFGGLAIHLAKTRKCSVTAVTISQEQFQYLNQKVANMGLEHLVKPVLADYRQIQGRYDKVISVELVDSLIPGDLATFFHQCDHILAPKGAMLHQLLLTPEHKQQKSWSQFTPITNYAVPEPLIPKLSELCHTLTHSQHLQITKLFDMTKDCELTYQKWRQSFVQNFQALGDLGFDQSFLRMWNYYLAYTESVHHLSMISCSQIVFKRV
ncbi:MAG: class I SAM-dependent methyltransferase [Pseudobacteriovorax sp.]|nr:class I SAM-dependent methyltransferase [Pseudobacteriovorax sp.]